MIIIQQLSQQTISIQSACAALTLPRRSYYRHQTRSSATLLVEGALRVATAGNWATTPVTLPATPEPAPTTRDEPVVTVTRTPASAPSPRVLSEAEEETVRQLLHSDRFADSSPYQVCGTLLDEGRYHCSIATMYRLLRADGEQHERCRHQVHPTYTKPELLATSPKQLWTWDISNASASLNTRFRGPVKWHYYYLYVLLDAFSRYDDSNLLQDC
jgi:hypothetical protein